MRTLVTGATGFIGHHLVRALLTRGDHVRILARDPAKAACLSEHVEIHSGDITTASEHLTRNIDVIFHLAAAVSGPWPRHRLITVEGTRLLARAAAASGVRRFVHISSLAVYDKSRIPLHEEVTEDSPLWNDVNAAGPYARGKIEAERIIQHEARRTDLQFVIARPGLVYGPGHTIFQHLGPRLGKGLFLPLGGGGVRLPLVHIDSVVDALLRLAETPDAAGRAFNIVDHEQITRSGYLRELSRANCRKYRCIGIPAAPITVAARAAQRLKAAPRALKINPDKIRARTTEHRYNCNALRTITGWQPAHDLERGLRLAFQPRTNRAPVHIRRVGIVGAGRMADFHIAALRQITGIKVAAILDINPRAAEALAHRHNIPLATADTDEFYSRARPDCVHILTPPQTHAPLAIEALHRGSHIMLEKPAVMSVQECDTIARVAQLHDLTVGVNHAFTADPRLRRARGLIERSAIGDLIHIDITWAFDIRRFHDMLAPADAAQSWLAQLPGGPLEDLAPHPLSIALMLLREQMHPVSTHSFRSGRLEDPVDDELRLLLAGCRTTAALTLTLSAQPDDMTVTIYGTRGTLRLDIQNLVSLRMRPLPGPKAITRGLRTMGAGLSTMMQTTSSAAALLLKRTDPPGSPRPLIHEHYAALAAGAPLPVDLHQARQVAEIVRAIWPELTTSPAGAPPHRADLARTTVHSTHAPAGLDE